MQSSQPLNSSTSQPVLVHLLRDQIRRVGPISFASFMEQALYHPVHGYYSSGRCAIGRRGDYFTSVSVGPIYGKLLAAQFAEIWEKLERPDDFTIVEQGAHHGVFAADVLEALRETRPALFATLRYRIVEPFPLLRQRQQGVLRAFGKKTEWCDLLEEMEPFSGVYFCNELVDAFPVHLLVGEGGEWAERFVDRTSGGFTFLERGPSEERLRQRLSKLPPAPQARYETEVCLLALVWVEALARTLRQGLALIADYGLTRDAYYAPARTSGTLQCYAEQRVLPSPLENVGTADLTTHVEWTSLAERAEASGLTIAGFTDQHHFLTGLLAAHPALAGAGGENSRALQTLLHPEFLGAKFHFLALAKHFSAAASLGGLQFAGGSRRRLGLG